MPSDKLVDKLFAESSRNSVHRAKGLHRAILLSGETAERHRYLRPRRKGLVAHRYLLPRRQVLVAVELIGQIPEREGGGHRSRSCGWHRHAWNWLYDCGMRRSRCLRQRFGIVVGCRQICNALLPAPLSAVLEPYLYLPSFNTQLSCKKLSRSKVRERGHGGVAVLKDAALCVR